MPLVSVVMPVRNGERHLRQAIDSILAQSEVDLELVIVDDGSTDRTPELLAHYADADPRVVLERQSPRGVTPASNRGLARARGVYIARMDADDVALPQRLARELAFLDAHPDVLAVGSAVLLIDDDGAALCEQRWPLEHAAIDAELLAGRSGLAHPSALFRADALQAIGGYREECHVSLDVDLCLRLAERGRLANLDEVLLHYRLHLGSIGHTRLAEQRATARASAAAACQRRGLRFASEAEPPPPTSRVEHQRRWARLALAGGHTATARKHAAAALRAAPLSPRSWLVWLAAWSAR